MSEQDKAAPVKQTICLNPVHKETICSQNQDFYTHKQKPEPVAWMESPYGEIRANPLYKIDAPQSVAWSIPLYTHPKEWVGLTEEDISLALGFGEFTVQIGRAHV